MAIAKVILNGDTLMDVTSNTNTSSNMLNGVVGTKNDGTSITGNIATKTSSNMTVSGATVTAPAGYYANDATKSISEGSAFPPAVTITKAPTISLVSSTGVVTASYTGSSSITPTVTAGYISQGTAGTVSTTGTNTYQLTSKAAATYNTSTADQTIASNQWLVGAQTIKSVTTTNLTAANIAEGVTIKVGDANNASRITQVTGTHSGSASYTATISGSGNSSYCYVTYNNTKYYTNGGTFTYKAGDTLTIYCRGNNATVNGDSVTLSNYSYTYTLPVGDITINLSYSSYTSNSIAIYGLIKPTGTYSVSAAGNHNVYKYSIASVPTGSAFPPATTITTNPSFTFVSSTGKVTASYTGTSYVTPTVTAGWVTTGTSGIISTTGTSTYTLTTQAAQTIYPSTADQTIASYRWLTGTQTIKSVTTTNLTASNIAEGVVIKVGDAYDASRITQVTGTHQGGGGSDAEDGIINRTISGAYENSRVSAIGSYAFTNCTKLTTASFPNVTTIGSYAFYYCSSLTTVSFPSVTSIGASAFTNCTKLTTASFPNVTSIGSSTFYNCTSLTTISFPNVTTIGSQAFTNCTKLTTASFPNVTTIGSSTFRFCHNLVSAIFLASSVASLGTSAFYSTPIGGNTTSTGGVYGSIYVPASLVNSYKTATNWSAYADRITSYV